MEFMEKHVYQTFQNEMLIYCGNSNQIGQNILAKLSAFVRSNKSMTALKQLVEKRKKPKDEIRENLSVTDSQRFEMAFRDTRKSLPCFGAIRES